VFCEKKCKDRFKTLALISTVEPGYNDIGLYDTSPIASDVLWYQLLLRR
jgi:hypothetical protein